MQIRKDITVIMCAPKCPGSVREEYKRGLGAANNAVHPENNPNGAGFEQAKAYAVALVVTKQEY
jgi:ketol-acid reductoisomerase